MALLEFCSRQKQEARIFMGASCALIIEGNLDYRQTDVLVNSSEDFTAIQTVGCATTTNPAGVGQESPGRKPWDERHKHRLSPAGAKQALRNLRIASASG